jgi:hypothetical protein
VSNVRASGSFSWPVITSSTACVTEGADCRNKSLPSGTKHPEPTAGRSCTRVKDERPRLERASNRSPAYTASGSSATRRRLAGRPRASIRTFRCAARWLQRAGCRRLTIRMVDDPGSHEWVCSGHRSVHRRRSPNRQRPEHR